MIVIPPSVLRPRNENVKLSKPTFTDADVEPAANETLSKSSHSDPITAAPLQAIMQAVQRAVLSGANDFLTNRSLLGPVDIHREAMMAAARCQLAAQLDAVFS